jgi:hypothetical protein
MLGAFAVIGLIATQLLPVLDNRYVIHYDLPKSLEGDGCIMTDSTQMLIT